MSYSSHLKSSLDTVVRFAVITLSDTRTMDDDKSGKKIVALMSGEGHTLIDHRILKDDPAELSPWLNELLGREDVDAILTTGGTGISRRDQTVSVVDGLIELLLPGFGELFRQLSYLEIGSGAMLSRAVGGVARGKLIFSMPGSTAAVELAMGKLILPEVRHLVYELSKS